MNHWQQVATDRAGRYSETASDAAYEQAMIAGEYAGHQNDGRPCDCGGTREYRATVGAYKCTDCGTLETHQGETLGRAPKVRVSR